jgi:amino acid adenylation domain-containing protein/non-ribosomal peptide synthase protein (TIGR01720 family)
MSEWQATNIASTLKKVFNSILGVSTETLKELDTFSEVDNAQVCAWNSTQSETVHKCVHEVFVEEAHARPEAEAICAWDGNFTYGELDELSTRLAHQLIALGVSPEVIVPLCFEKSAWTIVAMLAVMKAGGACVSLDPSHPMKRLQSTILDVGAKLALAGASTSALISPLVKVLLVIDKAFLDTLPITNSVPLATVQPVNTAFIIYTSGSTGKPKGVVLEHRSVCTSVEAHGLALKIGTESRVLQFAAYIFDISIQDIFTTLMRGGCVCVPSEQDRVNDLAGAINRMRVNWACITPTVAGLLHPSDVPGLETLTLAGEAVTKKVTDIWADLKSLNNCYGPAESTIYCAWNGSVGKTGMPSNIGQGLASLLWVVELEDHDRLASVGCIGELLLEGPLLARGYLNDPERTAASFIQEPRWARSAGPSNRRMYKTGDLVRYNSNGTLDYLGRKDSQVKVHGQRLELGEVEYHLSTDDALRSAMVMVPTKGQYQERLVAISALGDFVAESEALPHSTTLIDDSRLRVLGDEWREIASIQVSFSRERLSSELPLYMVPTAWIMVEAIPLNTSGKLDRAKVTEWVEEMDDNTYRQTIDAEVEEVVGPTTAMDRRLQRVLGRVLNLPVERIPLNKSFMGLGGDSITAMQVVSRARAEGIAIKVRDILQSKTIAQLAMVAKASSASSISKEDDVDTIFDLSPVQQMYFDMAGGKVNHFNQSFFLRFTQEVRPHDVARAIEALVRQHSMLRARFIQAQDGRWGQFITKDVAASYHFRLHEIKTRQGVTPIVAASQESLDVENGPIFTADLFTVTGEGQLLFLVAHHLVIDLVSWRVLLQDLEQILKAGNLSAETPFPFQAWCKLQVEHANHYLIPSKVLPFEVTPANYLYWDMERFPNIYGDAVSESFTIDVNSTSLLMGRCQEALKTEPMDVFLASLLHAFNQTFSDRATPTVFSEGHGREPWDEEIDLSRTVGWFTTISPLQVPVIQGADVVEMVRRVKDTRRKLPGNGWPYFTSRYLNAEGLKAFGGHSPMEVLFNYLGRYQQLEREGGLLRQETLPGLVSDVGPEVQRLALFEISVVLVQGVAVFSIVYSRLIQRQADIGRWMRAWKQSLSEVATRLSRMDTESTLSDFPLLSLTYAGLEKLKKERLRHVGVSSLAEVEDVYPCSPMQQGLLLGQTKQSGAYEVEFTFEVVPSRTCSPIDVKKFLLAWQQVVDRHAALRTEFIDSVTEDGLFDQLVLRSGTIRAVRKLWVEADSEALSVLQAPWAKVQTEGRPTHRLTVCETASEKVFYKLEVNHAIIDAASMSIIQRDLALAYSGTLPAGPGPLYSDYIRYLRDRPPHLAIDYWKAHLAGLEPCHFPLPKKVVDQRQLKCIGVDMNLTPDILSLFCNKNGVTIANVMQTAWGLVLRCYTGSDQICFGYLASGRDTAVKGIEEAVGPFINMLVCRMNINAASCAIELVQQVQMDCIAALDHQHCSLAQIQHALKLSGRPLFNTLMSIQRGSSSSDTGFQESDGPTIAFKSLDSHDPTEVNNTI